MSRREKRNRKYIPLTELLASALADRLPAAQRNELRDRRVPAFVVIRLFTPDHNHLHALGGLDLWWNLTMALRGADLKAKDARDTSIVAKSDRLVKSERERGERMAAKLYSTPAPSERPKRRIPSRPFPQQKVTLRSKNTFQRRR